MAQRPGIPGITFFTDAERRFVIWFCCTTTLPSAYITEMINEHFGTIFTVDQIREIVAEVRSRRRVERKFRAPRGDWICPQHFGIDCSTYQRPQNQLRLAAYYFSGKPDELRCCIYESSTSSDSGSNTSIEPPDPYPTTLEQEVETEPSASTETPRISQKSLLLPIFMVTLLAATTLLIYFGRRIEHQISIRHRWSSIKHHITETTMNLHHDLVSFKPQFQIKDDDRPHIFVMYCILFLMILGKINIFLSSLSPIAFQTLDSPPVPIIPGTITYRRWLTERFPYFFLRNRTSHHLTLTLGNLLAIIKSFLLDALYTTALFMCFYPVWLTSKVNCPSIHMLPGDMLSTVGERIVLDGREGMRDLFNELVSYFSSCVLPNLRLREFTIVGVMFVGCRYLGMVCFGMVGTFSRTVRRFTVGYQGE